jgi:hypothetical protein
MGYLGQEASFTGTQNNKRLSVVATAGQTSFFITNGYAINAIDVYRNGVKLIGQRDFTALDGVTVTLTQAANVNDVIEFVIFENFAVNDVVSTDGDSVIRGSIQINGNLTVVDGVLDATVTNTATAGFAQTAGIATFAQTAGIATFAQTAGIATFAQTAGISTQVSGYLGVGVTGYNLNLTGVATATSFSGSGANLTALNGSNVSSGTIAAARVATLNQDTTGTAALASGLTGTPNISCGTGAFSGDVTLQANLDLQDDDKILLGTGDDLEIYHNGTHSFITNATNDLNIECTTADAAIILKSNTIQLKDENNQFFIKGIENTGAVEAYYGNSKKLETSATGATVTGTLNATTDVTINGKGAATTGKAIAMAMVFG